MRAIGWRALALRVKDEIERDNVSLVAAGLALYALLAAFAALGAVVSLYGMFASPDQITRQLADVAGVMPQQAAAILQRALQNIASNQERTLSIGAILGLLLAIWSARKGMVALMQAMNIAFDQREQRGILRQALVSLALTFGAVLTFVLVLLLAAVAPIALGYVGLPEAAQSTLVGLRWVVLWLLIVLELAIVYRFAPNRHEPRWRWVTWGSAVAATLWIVGSLLFSLYVEAFGRYGETYGALGGVVVLLLWFYLSGYTVVLGAEIDAEIEHYGTATVVVVPELARPADTTRRRPASREQMRH